jgi:hypothetical protein
LVYAQCELGPRNYVKSEFDLFLKDKEILTAAQWPTILASEQSPFIDISVRFKSDGFKSGDSDSDSDSDPDNYLRRERRSTFRGNDLIYPHSRQRPIIEAEPDRGTHRFPERRTQLRNESTGDAGRERSKRPATYEDHYSPISPGRILDGAGTADVGHWTTHEVEVRPYDNRGKRKQRDIERTSSGHEGTSTTLDAAKIDPPDRRTSVVSFHIKEGERVIVAEPDSYYSTPDPGSRQSNTRANSMSLVVFNQRHDSIQIERPPRRTSLRNDSSYPPIQHAPPSSRRHSTFTDDHQNANIGLRRPQNASPLADNHHSAARRHEPVDAHPGLEERRFVLLNREEYAYDHRDRDIPPLQRRHSSHPSYPYRAGRARPSASGIISLATLGADAINEVGIGRGIYYRPKKRKKTTPAMNISDDSQTSKAKDPSPMPGKTKHGDGNPELSNTGPTPFKNLTINSQKEQKPGSLNSPGPVPPTKASVLPILMWPTEQPEDLDESHSNNGQNEGHVGAGGNHHPRSSKTGGPPRAINTSNSSNQRQISDSSLVEVLDRVYSYLLTDKSGKDDNVFMEMETAHQKDAIYNIPEQRGPSSQNEEYTDELPEGTQGGRSWYNPSEGGLNSRSRNASTQEHVGVPEYQTRLHQFSTTANKLLEAFVPADYPSPIIGRYYGAVRRIIKVRTIYSILGILLQRLTVQ